MPGGYCGTSSSRAKMHLMGIPRQKVPNTAVQRASRRSGLTPGYISRVLAAKRDPRLTTAVRIANAMDMTIDQLYQRICEKRRDQVIEKVNGEARA